MSDHPIIGWREWVSLPELGIEMIKAKVDTGARTSALHTFNIETFKKDGQDWVRFKVHPYQDDTKTEVECEAQLKDSRQVKDSGGHVEQRYVIETLLSVGDARYAIEMTLTNRDEMNFRMLLGRTALKKHFLVNPALSYLSRAKPAKKRKGQNLK